MCLMKKVVEHKQRIALAQHSRIVNENMCNSCFTCICVKIARKAAKDTEKFL